ncbi:hypothetical protein D3868_25610 (plasmid) [Azospirillum brasilense]|uniref:Transposase n=1 Tax=Azospirillum brasilense TaxID=192 RepID=A0A4D8QNI1_AZOBR|nr:hypothetical protein D3868_25610 [Azospirillum brasilense]
MTKQASPRYAPEVRERAVRMVFEHEGEHASQWAAITSIGSCPEAWCRSRGAHLVTGVSGRKVHVVAAGNVRARSSRKGAMVSRVM